MTNNAVISTEGRNLFYQEPLGYPGLLRRYAFTFVELLISVVIFSLVVNVVFFIWKNTGKTANKTSKNALYFSTIGRFLSQFRQDLRLASKMKKDGDTLILIIEEDFDSQREIRYVQEPSSSKIVRSSENKNQVFFIGPPPPGAKTFIFRIE